jgi:hypothetical protein
MRFDSAPAGCGVVPVDAAAGLFYRAKYRCGALIIALQAYA